MPARKAPTVGPDPTILITPKLKAAAANKPITAPGLLARRSGSPSRVMAK